MKRQFVTTHQLQQQQDKKATQVGLKKLPEIGTLKSPRLNKVAQVNDDTIPKSATARRKLYLQNLPHEDKKMGENEHEDP